ncbi:MAG: hypothetical protein ACLPXB_00975 [Thiobacillaceae bacterium]
MAAEPDDDILDDMFLGCALAAYQEQARIQQGWPDSDPTRKLAYRYYEDALAEQNARTMPGLASLNPIAVRVNASRLRSPVRF